MKFLLSKNSVIFVSCFIFNIILLPQYLQATEFKIDLDLFKDCIKCFKNVDEHNKKQNSKSLDEKMDEEGLKNGGYYNNLGNNASYDQLKLNIDKIIELIGKQDLDKPVKLPLTITPEIEKNLEEGVKICGGLPSQLQTIVDNNIKDLKELEKRINENSFLEKFKNVINGLKATTNLTEGILDIWDNMSPDEREMLRAIAQNAIYTLGKYGLVDTIGTKSPDYKLYQAIFLGLGVVPFMKTIDLKRVSDKLGKLLEKNVICTDNLTEKLRYMADYFKEKSPKKISAAELLINPELLIISLDNLLQNPSELGRFIAAGYESDQGRLGRFFGENRGENSLYDFSKKLGTELGNMKLLPAKSKRAAPPYTIPERWSGWACILY